MTFPLKSLVMMSLPLPQPVFDNLQHAACQMEEGLQAQAHTVDQAVRTNGSFNTNWVESGLIRAVIAGLAQHVGSADLRIDDLGMGGVEVVNTYKGVERRFRMRKARRNRRGNLVVTVSSDSMLTLIARDPTLFDDEATRNAPPPKIQQWVLAYLLIPGTHTFSEISAGRVAGLIGNQAPYRLDLADVRRIPHTVPLPPDFKPDTDDLDLGEEEDGLKKKGTG